MKKHFREMFYRLPGNRKFRNLEIEQEDLLGMVSNNHKALKNLGTILTLLIISIWFLVHFAIFLINDVILFRKDISVNETGAFMQSKTCDSEQAMFLFTTSELWSNSGIQLHKGDRIKLSTSGAFNTSIQEVYNASRLNKKPKYPWTSMDNLTDTLPSSWQQSELTIYPVSHFGAVLYQIRKDAEPLQSDWSKFLPEVLNPEELKDEKKVAQLTDSISKHMGIHKLESSDEYIEVKEDGLLYLSVNDIYLNDAVIRKYATENQNILKKGIKDGTLKLNVVGNDTVGYDTLVNVKNRNLFSLYYYPTTDKATGDSMVYIGGRKFNEYFKQNRDAWFKDNVGQIAVTADIQHRINDWPMKQISWYRMIETQVVNIKNNPWNILWLVLEFIIVIPLIFLVVYSVLTILIYLGISVILWCWNLISEIYIKTSGFLKKRLH